uniref:Glycosyltransferase family 1 protein n=1 Tax=candidate division CPR3 bacterium TaxID=2268181 RepID=A0A7V3J9H3_UNCC3
MKVAIIEPNLVDYTGHSFSFVSELKQGFEELGDKVEVFMPKNSTAPLSGVKVLPRVNRSQASAIRNYSNIILDIFRFARVLRNIQRRFDVLVFTSADDPRTIGGVSLIWTKKPLIFYFHAPELYFKPMGKSLKLLKISNELRRKPVSFITPATLEQKFTQDIFFKNIRFFPEAPYPLKTPPRLEKLQNCNDYYLGYLGDARKEKNFTSLIELIDAAPEEIGFIVQCNPPGIGYYEPGIKEGVEHIKGLQRDRLFIFEEPLPQKEYRELLNKSSIVWCLYDESQYRDRVSGILLEAWSLGKPVITTSGTWMAKQVEKYGGGIVLDTLEVQDILKAIEEIRGNYARFSAEAENAGRILYEKNNGVALARFIKDIVRK